MKNKTNKELLAWIDGYLKAHIDDGLTTQQIAKILDEISKETIEISPLPNFPYFEPNPLTTQQIAKILDEIPKETIEISPLPNFPYFEPNPIYKDQFYTTTKPYTGDNTSS